jgi:hypothetical protein
MRARYYTRFIMRSDDSSLVDEYSGVVELNQAANQVLEPREIEALLARNFEREQDQVELLNWSRIH